MPVSSSVMIGRRGSLTRSEESRVRDYVAAFQREVRPDGGDDQALFHPRPGEGEIIVGPGSCCWFILNARRSAAGQSVSTTSK